MYEREGVTCFLRVVGGVKLKWNKLCGKIHTSYIPIHTVLNSSSIGGSLVFFFKGNVDKCF